MTSFLRTRKDRHPKPESKVRLPHEQNPSGDQQRGASQQPQIHHAYQEQRDVPPDSNRRGNNVLDDTNQDSDSSKRSRGTVRKNHNGTLTLSLDK